MSCRRPLGTAAPALVATNKNLDAPAKQTMAFPHVLLRSGGEAAEAPPVT
jgi:hypothetical protein